MNKNIFITGFMGSGKSRVGRMLASRLKWKFIDTDKQIEDQTKKTIAEIFENEGEAAFRIYESIQIQKITNTVEKCVVALGGGALLSQSNTEKVLNNGTLIYLESSLEDIWDRVKNKKHRPLLFEMIKNNDQQYFIVKAEKLLQKRIQGYKRAHIKINRVGWNAEEIVEMIINDHKNLLPL